MVAYVCDFCGEVLSSATNKINRKENPYFAIINIDFENCEKQYHCCKNCLVNLLRGSEVQAEIDKAVKTKTEWRDH